MIEPMLQRLCWMVPSGLVLEKAGNRKKAGAAGPSVFSFQTLHLSLVCSGIHVHSMLRTSLCPARLHAASRLA